MNIFRILPGLVILMFLLGSCKYDFIVPEEIIDPTGPEAPEISLTTDILPIFNNGNNCTACHKTGGKSPDLTVANAFISLNSSKYINAEKPGESKIYTVPKPDGNHAKKYTEGQAALVLAWISQGAKNN